MTTDQLPEAWTPLYRQVEGEDWECRLCKQARVSKQWRQHPSRIECALLPEVDLAKVDGRWYYRRRRVECAPQS